MDRTRTNASSEPEFEGVLNAVRAKRGVIACVQQHEKSISVAKRRHEVPSV